MSWSKSIPVGVGVFVAVIAVAVIGAAMFIGESGEEALHLYRSYSSAARARAPANPMELQGKWKGLTVVPVDGPTAEALGASGSDEGLVVAQIPEGHPARHNGLMLGDVVVGVDGQKVRDLSDLYNVSRSTSGAEPALLDVRRHGQALTVFLPAAPPAGVATPELEGQNAWPWQGPGGGRGVQAGWGGQQLLCPHHGMVGAQGGPGVGYSCPICRGPVHRGQAGPYTPYPQPLR